MSFATRSRSNVNILDISGRFDAHLAPRVVSWLDSVTASAPAQVVINLTGATFLDSAALAALVHGLKRCRQQGGDLRLCSLQQPVRIIIELTRINRAIDIFADEDAALGAPWAGAR